MITHAKPIYKRWLEVPKYLNAILIAFEMFFLSILAFSPFLIAPALSLKILDSDLGLPDCTSGTSTVIGPSSALRITNCVTAPDGNKEEKRAVTSVGGDVTGPLIKAYKGDNFSVNVVNLLEGNLGMPVETSVHFHGIFQKGSNWADGVPYVTQCPLRPYESFEHRFNTIGQVGTYWYHSHYKNQYCDGLRGPLVIYDPDDPMKCDPDAQMKNGPTGKPNGDEQCDPAKIRKCDPDRPRFMDYNVDDETTVITLEDWYYKPSLELDTFPRSKQDSILINGKGCYAGGPVTKDTLSVINVKQGLRYRLRLVSMACNPTFLFSIEKHKMTIVEADGNLVSPVEVSSIPILPGQRYSVVITADQDPGNYWIYSPNTARLAPGLAILRYEGAEEKQPSACDQYGPTLESSDFDEGDLHPCVSPAAPDTVDVKLVFNVGNTLDTFTMNGVSYVEAPMPVLLQILSGKKTPSELLPEGSVYTLPPSQVVEISFPSPTATDAPHPMHLHGHDFYVVRVAGTTETNYKNPVRRDVVTINSLDDTKQDKDEVTIRFKTDNPGPWIFHCHNEWHLGFGFAVVLAEAPNETAIEQAEVIPQDWYKLCPPGEDWGQTRLVPLGF